MKRTCSGYRHQSNLTFRDEDYQNAREFQQWQSRSHRPYPRSAKQFSILRDSLQTPMSDYNDCMNITYQLSTTTEDFATCHFYHATLETCQIKILHETFTPATRSRTPNAVLVLHCAWQRQQSHSLRFTKLLQEATQLSRKRYVQAIKAVRNALPDQQEATNDETLYAILLLCGYEVKSLF